MMSILFNLQDVPTDYLTEPYSFLAKLRMQSPVHNSPDGTFVLTSYHDIVQTYRDPVIWSSDKKDAFGPKFGDTPLF